MNLVPERSPALSDRVECASGFAVGAVGAGQRRDDVVLRALFDNVGHATKHAIDLPVSPVAVEIQTRQRRCLRKQFLVRHWTHSLQPAGDHASTYDGKATELFSVSKWEQNANYRCKPGITRASLGMLSDLQPVHLHEQ